MRPACHPEQAVFAQRRMVASRAKCRVFGDTTIARLACVLILISAFVLVFCSGQNVIAATTASDVAALPDEPSSPPSFNATRAMQYTKEIVAFGPRPIGSANHKKVEEFILAHIKGDDGRGGCVYG